MTKWSTLTPNESLIDSTTEMVDLQNGNSNQRIRASIPALGQLVVPVHKLSDIPLLNGFRQLEQDKVYRFVEEISSSESLLVPAGWNGYIVGMHNSLTKYDYSGSIEAIKTLDITGTILSIADAGSGAITVTTSAAHGLVDGQYVNITGTTSYNQQKLEISNTSGSVFDVQLVFVADESGAFDTGYNTINIMNMGFTNADTATWLDIQAADQSSMFRYNNMKVNGFAALGFILGGRIIGYDGDLDTTGEGLSISNIDKANISKTTISNLGSDINRNLFAVSGSLTRDIVLREMQFNVTVASQSPVSVDDNLPNTALVYVINSPDNNIATEYFELTGSGIGEKDPRVSSFNNGLRANSTTESESRSTVVLEVDGSGGAGVPVAIEDITPAPGDFELDSASAGFSMDTSTGVVTYNGIAPISVLIGYNLEASQTSGANQNLTFDLRINGVQQTKTIKTLITMGVGDFVSVANIGGLFTINTNDTFQLFKTNVGNANNTDIQNTILLIR